MILAIESSGKTASVAIVKDGAVVCESSQTLGFFHSQTLMVILSDLISTAKILLKDLTLVAVSNGPGSFTGLRIGVSAAKGLATGLGIACVGISTLRGLAVNLYGLPVIVCAVIDARNNFLYCGLYDMQKNEQIGYDEVILLDDLLLKLQLLKSKKKPIVLVGDGAKLCYFKFKEQVLQLNLRMVNDRLNLASAASVGLCAYFDFKAGNLNTNFQLNYMRQSQAQRMLNEKMKEKGDCL